MTDPLPEPPAWLAPAMDPETGVIEGSVDNPDAYFVYPCSDQGCVLIDGTLTPQQLRELADYVEAVEQRR